MSTALADGRDKRNAARWGLLVLASLLVWEVVCGVGQAVAQGAPAPSGETSAAPGPQTPQQAYAPPPQAYPPAPPPAYPQQAYPQQAYPQQAYPQQPYPQQPYPQQAYPQAYPQQPYPQAAPRKPRASRGLLIAGIVTLSASYGIAAIVGSSLIDTHCCNEVGAYMLVPIVGPYLAAGKADDGKGVLTLLGTVEVVGTALLIGGLVRYRRTKREAEGIYTFQLPERRSLSLDLTTSPRLVGPSMRLKF